MKHTYTAAVIVAASLAVAGGSAMAFGGHGKGEARGQMRFEQLDADKDGKLSREEMQAGAALRFGTADANSDGKITAEEMNASGAKRAEKRFGKMLERLDSDKDGALSLEEMQGGERHAQMFERLDADKDGFVSKDEMGDMRKMRGHGKKQD